MAKEVLSSVWGMWEGRWRPTEKVGGLDLTYTYIQYRTCLLSSMPWRQRLALTLTSNLALTRTHNLSMLTSVPLTQHVSAASHCFELAVVVLLPRIPKCGQESGALPSLRTH